MELDAARHRVRRVIDGRDGGGESGGRSEARMRTGDHTPHLLVRLARLPWVGPALGKIESWLKEVDGNIR